VGGRSTLYMYVLKTPVNMSVYSVDETFDWSLPFHICLEHRIVDKQQESVGYVTFSCER